MTAQVVGRKLPHYELFGEDIAIARQALKLAPMQVLTATSDFVDLWLRTASDFATVVWPMTLQFSFQVGHA
jgi:hypothetical protein